MIKAIAGTVVWKFDDNFNSDLITSYPQYKDIEDEDGLRRICMSSYDPDFFKKVKKGDVLVAGHNFGFGHPHVQAHYSIKAVGISCVIAESIARQWLRTAISVGLPAIACKGIHDFVSPGDRLEVDMSAGQARNASKGTQLRFTPMPAAILDVLESGGTIPYLRESIERAKKDRTGASA